MTDEWMRRVEHRLHSSETRNAVEEVYRAAVEKRLASIEDTLKWLVRLVIGALLMSLVAYALKGGFLPV